MDFITTFQQSVKANRMANMEFSPQMLIPSQYEYQEPEEDFLHLLAGGSIHTSQPFSFSFDRLDCLLLCCTTAGGGRLSCQGLPVSMTERSLMLLDCRQSFSLQAEVLPWNFKLLFISGRDLKVFSRLFPSLGLSLFSLPEYSPLFHELDRLMGIPVHVDLSGLLLMHQALTNIFCTLGINSVERKPQKKELPSYLLEMKNCFDQHYEREFSLEYYEEYFHISRYRLCREFSRAFGDSPLRYLNSRRLKMAKEMLLTTDLNVQEISSSIGFDNVNHFIHLFKKNTGTTPGAFRQRALEAPAASRSPVQ